MGRTREHVPLFVIREAVGCRRKVPGNQRGFLGSRAPNDSPRDQSNQDSPSYLCSAMEGGHLPPWCLWGPVSLHCGLAGPQRKPLHCLPGTGDRLPTCWGLTHPAAPPHLPCRAPPARAQRPHGLRSCSARIHLDGADAVLGPALTLKAGTVVSELQPLASEVTAPEDVQAEMCLVPRGPPE